MLYMLARVVDGLGELVGFRLHDTNLNQTRDFNTDIIANAIISNKVHIENLDFKNGKFIGTCGSLSRYATLRMSGELVGHQSCIILKKIDDNTYRICNLYGQVSNISLSYLDSVVQKSGAVVSNARIGTSKDGKKYLALLSGNMEEEVNNTNNKQSAPLENRDTTNRVYKLVNKGLEVLGGSYCKPIDKISYSLYSLKSGRKMYVESEHTGAYSVRDAVKDTSTLCGITFEQAGKRKHYVFCSGNDVYTTIIMYNTVRYLVAFSVSELRNNYLLLEFKCGHFYKGSYRSDYIDNNDSYIVKDILHIGKIFSLYGTNNTICDPTIDYGGDAAVIALANTGLLVVNATVGSIEIIPYNMISDIDDLSAKLKVDLTPYKNVINAAIAGCKHIIKEANFAEIYGEKDKISLNNAPSYIDGAVSVKLQYIWDDMYDTYNYRNIRDSAVHTIVSSKLKYFLGIELIAALKYLKHLKLDVIYFNFSDSLWHTMQTSRQATKNDLALLKEILYAKIFNSNIRLINGEETSRKTLLETIDIQDHGEKVYVRYLESIICFDKNRLEQEYKSDMAKYAEALTRSNKAQVKYNLVGMGIKIDTDMMLIDWGDNTVIKANDNIRGIRLTRNNMNKSITINECTADKFTVTADNSGIDLIDDIETLGSNVTLVTKDFSNYLPLLANHHNGLLSPQPKRENSYPKFNIKIPVGEMSAEGLYSLISTLIRFYLVICVNGYANGKGERLVRSAFRKSFGDPNGIDKDLGWLVYNANKLKVGVTVVVGKVKEYSSSEYSVIPYRMVDDYGEVQIDVEELLPMYNNYGIELVGVEDIDRAERDKLLKSLNKYINNESSESTKESLVALDYIKDMLKL